jgi:hypothetical protein
MIRVFVYTCDRYSWLLRGFATQFNKYWSELQPVVVAGYKPPEFDLPSNFEFHSIAPVDYGKDRWTTGLIEFLQSVEDEHFVFLLEDYWLCRGVNHQAVETLHEFCQQHPQVLRMDLTDDRMYNGRMKEFNYVPYYGYLDIIWTPPESDYQCSTQAAIWSRRNLLSVLVSEESGWQMETYKPGADTGTAKNIRNRTDLWVLGTRQRPVRYANIVNKENLDNPNLEGLLPEDIKQLESIGAFKK